MSLICKHNAKQYINVIFFLWCIKLSYNPVFHEKSKHFEIDYHFTRHKVENKTMKVEFIPSQEQPTYILTKSLGRIGSSLKTPKKNFIFVVNSTDSHGVTRVIHPHRTPRRRSILFKLILPPHSDKIDHYLCLIISQEKKNLASLQPENQLLASSPEALPKATSVKPRFSSLPTDFRRSTFNRFISDQVEKSARRSVRSTANDPNSLSTRSCNEGRRSHWSTRNQMKPGVSTRTISKAAHSKVVPIFLLQALFILLSLHKREIFTLWWRRGRIRVSTNSSLGGGNNVASWIGSSWSLLLVVWPLTSKTRLSITSINWHYTAFQHD